MTKCLCKETKKCVRVVAEISISPDVVVYRLRWSYRPIISQPPYTGLRTHGGKHTDRQVLGKSNRAGVMMMMMCDGTVAAGQQSSGFSSPYRFRSAVSKQEITFTCRGIQSTKGEEERNRSAVWGFFLFVFLRGWHVLMSCLISPAQLLTLFAEMKLHTYSICFYKSRCFGIHYEIQPPPGRYYELQLTWFL